MMKRAPVAIHKLRIGGVRHFQGLVPGEADQEPKLPSNLQVHSSTAIKADGDDDDDDPVHHEQNTGLPAWPFLSARARGERGIVWQIRQKNQGQWRRSTSHSPVHYLT